MRSAKVLNFGLSQIKATTHRHSCLKGLSSMAAYSRRCDRISGDDMSQPILYSSIMPASPLANYEGPTLFVIRTSVISLRAIDEISDCVVQFSRFRLNAHATRRR